MKRCLAVLLVLTSAGVLGFSAYVTYDNLMGAFGPGEYDYRTANMDKWQNPIPYLIALDFIAFVIIFFLLRWARRLWRATAN